MTQMEVLVYRLMNIGYTQDQAESLVSMYEQNDKTEQLKDYTATKESLRGEKLGKSN